MQSIQFPLVGNSLIMALVIFTHVFLAFIAVGGIPIAVVSEFIGYRRKSLYHDLLARRYMTFISNLMKVGGVLGSMIVILLIGLFPEFTKTLFNIFFWPFVLEAALFLTLFAASIFYKETWDTIKDKRIHLAGGFVAGFAGIFAGLVINAIHSFMLTPGDYFKNPSVSSAVFNPTMVASSTHLLIPCFINAAVAFFFYSLYKSNKGDEKDRLFYEWAVGYTGRIAAWSILLQPLSGLSFLFTIKSVDDSIFNKIVFGNVAFFFWPMVLLASIAVMSSILFLSRPKKKPIFMIVAGLCVFMAFPFGGYTRERARKPYLIHDYMYMNQNLAQGVESQNPVVSEAKYGNLMEEFEEHGCVVCHTYKGVGGTFGPNLSNLHYTKEQIVKIIKNPPEEMPPFLGPEEDIEKIAEMLSK